MKITKRELVDSLSAIWNICQAEYLDPLPVVLNGDLLYDLGNVLEEKLQYEVEFVVWDHLEGNYDDN